jgi:hypothetical protein
MTAHSRGRPAASRNVRVTPEFREKPDIEQLARVLLNIADKLKEKPADEKGDVMT